MAERHPVRGLKMLRGRRSECEVVEGLLERVRAGTSGALVVRGEAGVGENALLENGIEEAAGIRVVRGVGLECLVVVAFSVLQKGWSPMLDLVRTLAPPSS